MGRDVFIPPRRDTRLVFIWTKYIAGMKPFKCLTSYFCCNKGIYACSKGKNSSRLVGIKCFYGNFSSRLGGMKCLYENFSSRSGGIPVSVADIPSRRDKWRNHIGLNTLYNLYYTSGISVSIPSRLAGII
jgi:hypothetical protein